MSKEIESAVNENEDLSYLNDINSIKELFILIISELNESLQLKQKLFSFKNFFPDILFLKLDYFSKKKLCIKDILIYLEQHNYKFNNEIIRNFIKHYDKHGGMNLIYDDFLKFISPQFSPKTNIALNENDNISENIDAIFCDILIKELQMIGYINDMTLKIRKNKEIDSHQIFMGISRNRNNNFLDRRILYDFLDGKFHENEINQLIYFIDSDNDGLISYGDFRDLLIPIKSDFESQSEENNDEMCINENNDNINNDMNNINVKQRDNIEDEICHYNDENENNKSNYNLVYNQKDILSNYNICNNNYEDFEMMVNKENKNILNNQKLEGNQNFNNITYNLVYDNNKGNNTDFNKNISNNFSQKIFKEEKTAIPDLKKNNFPINFIDNNKNLYIQDTNLTQNNFPFQQFQNIYPKDSNSNNIYIQNEIQKNGIDVNHPNNTLPQFPITFGNNKLNFFNNQPNEKETENNINNEINHNYNIIDKNKIKEEMNYYINRYLNNNNNLNLDENDNNINIKNKNIQYKKNENLIEEIKIFIEYINSIILNENKIEQIKETLSLREDISLKEIFILFDKEQKNYISINNFELICKKVFNIFPTLDQIKLVFKRYKNISTTNKKNSLNLNFDEFLHMMIPEKMEYRDIVNRKNSIDTTNIKLSKKTKNIITQLIKLIIQKESIYYKIKNKLNEDSIEGVWNEMVKFSYNNKKVNKNTMNKFLVEYDCFLSEKQIDKIFIIFDKVKKGFICDNDFFEEMNLLNL